MPKTVCSATSLREAFYRGESARGGTPEGRIKTSVGLKSVAIYCGDGNTASGQVCPDMLSLINRNIHRVAKKNLADYPTVFTEEKGLSAFLKYRTRMYGRPVDITSADLLNMAKGGYIRPVREEYYIGAMLAMPVFLARDFKFSADEKLYITGHGSAGRSALVVDQAVLSMDNVVEKLIKAGVPKNTKDIRMESCHSASAKRALDLEDGCLDRYSQAFIERHNVFGFSLGSTKREAPAKYLLDALRGQGFDEVVVTGYHGAGVYDDGESFPRSALRNASTSTSPDFDKTAAVRRSTVAHRFTSEVD